MNSRNPVTSVSDLRWPVVADVTPPETGVVRIWCSLLRCGAEALSRLEQLLSPEEAQRAARFRTEELRQRFVVAHGVLRRVLGGCLKTNPARMQFVADAKGKPHLAEDCGVQFNLAHTGDLMLLAVTSGMPVGVDLERIRPMHDAQGIARRFFTQREADWLQRRNADGSNRAFFSLWTRKEAVLKATGEGIGGGLDSLELLEPKGTFSKIVVRQHEDRAATSWALTELEPATGFIGALALPAGAGRVPVRVATFQPA